MYIHTYLVSKTKSNEPMDPLALFNFKPLHMHTSMENRKNKIKQYNKKNRNQKGYGSVYTLMTSSSKISKKSNGFFGQFWALLGHFGPNDNCPENSGSATLEPLWTTT